MKARLPVLDQVVSAMMVFLSGGGMNIGQVIGSTNNKDEGPWPDPVTHNDFLATLYHAMGVPLDTQFHDQSGRPTAIVPNGEPIKGLF